MDCYCQNYELLYISTLYMSEYVNILKKFRSEENYISITGMEKTNFR